jgi:uncharacterized protein (TIGR03437 family)
MTGAPGDSTCAQSGCHTGTALNGGGGSVRLASSEGTTYTPGKTQTLTIAIADSSARAYGFQATARLDSSPTSGQAGSFTASTNQMVICANGSLRGASGCPSRSPLQFVEHSRALSTSTVTFSWTAPSSDVGTITIYAAANAANANNNDSGDHIYTTSLKLSPAAATSNLPTIASGGVVSASAFRPSAGAGPGTWLEIFGSNLSSTTRSWSGADFDGNTAPTSLDGVSVTIGGKSAYVDFVSLGQVNALVPDGIAIGSGVPVVVANSQGQSDPPYTVTTSSLVPALLAPPKFLVGGKQYAVAVFPANDANSTTYVGPVGANAGVTMQPAKPGDVITVYGIGFGPVSPATAAGTIAMQSTSLANQVTVQIGQIPATVQYAGLAPGFVGLYQFNIEIPSAAAGDQPLVVQVNGTNIGPSVYLTIGQ